MCSTVVFKRVADDLSLLVLSRRIHSFIVQRNVFLHCILTVELSSDGACGNF